MPGRSLPLETLGAIPILEAPLGKETGPGVDSLPGGNPTPTPHPHPAPAKSPDLVLYL